MIYSEYTSIEALKSLFSNKLNYEFESSGYLSLLDESNTATYQTNARNVLLLRPKSIEELVFILKSVSFQNEMNVKNEVKVKHHINVVSTMKNFGYGCADPIKDGAILIYLKDMSVFPDLAPNCPRWVSDYGKELGIVEIGPGVSQQNLFDFLESEKSGYAMDATGSSVEASVLANYIERGFGHTKAGNHFNNIVGMEIVKMDGSVIKLGHAAFESTANVGVHKNGVGPALMGLFSQSNFAIVTAISLQLIPISKYVLPFFIQVKSDLDFSEALIKLRSLKKNGTLESQMHCGNNLKSIQAAMMFPVKKNEGYGCLKEEVVKSLSKENGYATWTISGAIYANSFLEIIDKCLKLRSSLSTLSVKKIYLSESMLIMIKTLINMRFIQSIFSKATTKLNAQLGIVSELINLKKGRPTNYFLSSTYWRMRGLKSEKDSVNDLRKDGVGLIWLAPIAPLTKKNIKKLINITYSGQQMFSFEPAISMTMLDESAIDCVVSIIFDNRIEEESVRALKCHDHLLEKYIEAGFIPYRLGSRSVIQNLNVSPTYSVLLKDLKNALDPDELLMPSKTL